MGLRGLRDYLLAWRIARVEDRKIEDKPPIPVVIVGASSSGDTSLNLVNTSGEVTEASGATTAGRVNTTNAYILGVRAQYPLNAKADGTSVSYTTDGPYWAPGIPVAITADGGGAVGAAVEVQPLIALHRQDCVWTVQVSVSGLHQLDFIENTAAAAVTVPDYHTAPPDVFLVAGFPYVFRLMNATAAVNLGVNAGAAGYFPNNSVMTVTPMFRDIGV